MPFLFVILSCLVSFNPSLWIFYLRINYIEKKCLLLITLNIMVTTSLNIAVCGWTVLDPCHPFCPTLSELEEERTTSQILNFKCHFLNVTKLCWNLWGYCKLLFILLCIYLNNMSFQYFICSISYILIY